MTVDNIIINTNVDCGKKKVGEAALKRMEQINYRLQGSSTQFVFEVSRRRRGPQYQRSTGDNPLQEIFAF